MFKGKKKSSNRLIYEIDDDELLIGTVETPTFKKIHTTEAKCRVQKIKTVPQVKAVENRNDEWYSTLKLGEPLVKLELDTGGKCNMLPE